MESILNRYNFLPLLKHSNGKETVEIYHKIEKALLENGDKLLLNQEELIQYLKKRYENEYNLEEEEQRKVILHFTKK